MFPEKKQMQCSVEISYVTLNQRRARSVGARVCADNEVWH